MNSKTTLATQLRKSIDDSLDRLTSAVDEQRGSEEVKRYLDMMARFPTYSWRNACLVSLQRPQASIVAGFSHWKRLGRSVRKGEKAIRILAPCPVRRKAEDDEEPTPVFFKAACVFDVSQTEGKELPRASVPDIETRADALLKRLEHVTVLRDITLRYGALTSGTYGTSRTGQIEIAQGFTTGQQAKTLAHELAHGAMHHNPVGRKGRRLERAVAELEAEAVAYVVCRHFGLDVELRASRYIALWGGDAKALAASLARVSEVARGLIGDAESVGPTGGDVAQRETGVAMAVPVPASAQQHCAVTRTLSSQV